ncbi:MAG TPA: hypothetical protein PK987_03435, partial [Ferruginibacter sp.]|nr:hypothetical protein [Ferruginibacter sp.]
MLTNRIYIVILFITTIISSCTKKNHPATSVKTTETTVVKKRKVVSTIPKVIIVNDKVAKRSVDGRYYYDLQGHRYWRNNKDGKYYLFHKSMFDDEDFKSP